MRLNKYINIILFISLASCHNEEEQPIPPTPTMSSFVPGSRLEWRKLMASDGSKIDALIPPRFWDKERKEPCDLDYASAVEKKQGVYRCLPVFELEKNRGYVTVWQSVYSDPDCSIVVASYKYVDYAKTYPGKYNVFAVDPIDRSINAYCETSTSLATTSFYMIDDDSKKCVTKTLQIPDHLKGYTFFPCKKINPNDFVMVSF